MIGKKKVSSSQIILHIFFIITCCCFVFPMLLVVSVSFSSEASVTTGAGFQLIPEEFSLDAYKMAFRNPASIIKGYIITIAQAVLGTFSSCIICGMIAYPLSRSNFRFKKIVTTFLLITMLFGGGTIPTYIVYTKYYHLGNNFLIYVLPGLAGGAWNTFMFRTFFKSIPESLFESARIDGAKELDCYFRIAIPLSMPVYASLGFMTLVAKWNDYMTSMIYIRDPDLYTVQYLLQRTLNEVEFLKSLTTSEIGINMGKTVLPAETMKYALCVICAGPMLFVFPFFQKYFSRGLTVGSVKG